MIQVRCPECGFIQSMSEERFVSITEDHLDCPHCNARVPKEWGPVDDESIPEEARHKLRAFSLRILNGGEVNRDAVYALESLVRHYGSTEESLKALGIGYAALGEKKKAEEFLTYTLKAAPNDLESLRSLFAIRMDRGDFEGAVETGGKLVDSLGPEARGEDLARLAIAMTQAGRENAARAVLDGILPEDESLPMVKQAFRLLGRSKRGGILDSIRNSSIWERFFPSIEREGLAALTEKARAAIGAGKHERSRAESDADSRQESSVVPRKIRSTEPPRQSPRPLLEYWIYAPSAAVPNWETIGRRLAEMITDEKTKLRIFRMLEYYSERDELKLDYIFRRDAEALFAYPEELLPRNAKGMTDEDKETLTGAQMIVRVQLTTGHFKTQESIEFAVRFVETVRDLTGGIVQDAISHALWGTEEWRSRVVSEPQSDRLSSHVHFEILDEGGTLWIHSHGMAKFGLPEMELESVPREMVGSAVTLIHLTGNKLLEGKDTGLNFSEHQDIANTPVLFMMRQTSPDDEGHFPLGSLKIHPYLPDYDPESPDTLRHVLRTLSRLNKSGFLTEKPAEDDSTEARPKETESDTEGARLALIQAHEEARRMLGEFKQSFREGQGSDQRVYAVKVGFPLHNGEYEWMWVSLNAWRGASLVGILENTPVMRRDLSKGSRVELHEGEIFDWAIADDGDVIKGAFTESVDPSQSPPPPA